MNLTNGINNIIFQKKNGFDFEEFVDLSQYKDSFYRINIELKQNDDSYNSFLFYIYAYDYPGVPLTINTTEFHEFMIFSDIDLLLDVSTIKKNDKLIIEHSIEWISQTIIAQGYDFSEPEQINKDNGKKLELTLNYSYIDSKVCKRYITVDNDNLKMIILGVNKPKYMDDIYIFDIKYYIEKYQIPIPVDDEENSKTDKKETDKTDKTDNIVPYVPFDKTKTEGVDYSEINFIFLFFIKIT